MVATHVHFLPIRETAYRDAWVTKIVGFEYKEHLVIVGIMEQNFVIVSLSVFSILVHVSI